MEESPGKEAPFRWAPRDIAAFVVFFLVTVFVFPAAAFYLLRLFDPTLQIETLSGASLVVIQALMNLVIVGFVSLMIRSKGGQILPSLRLVPDKTLPVGQLIAGGAFLAISGLILSWFLPAPTESPYQQLLSTTASIIVFVVFGTLFAPLLEEIIFRGFVYTAFADIEGPGTAVPVTALLFAALHAVQLWGSWSALIVIFLVGYVLTVIRRRFDSLVPPIIVHTAYNGMIFAVSALGSLLNQGKVS